MYAGYSAYGVGSYGFGAGSWWGIGAVVIGILILIALCAVFFAAF